MIALFDRLMRAHWGDPISPQPCLLLGFRQSQMADLKPEAVIANQNGELLIVDFDEVTIDWRFTTVNDFPDWYTLDELGGELVDEEPEG